jgi:amino-acid N-acetyltransferase
MSLPPVLVRPAATADAARISALVDLFVPSGTLLPRAEAFVAAHVPDFLVAEQGGRIIGCVHLEEYAPSLAEVRSLAVDPSAQASGVGVLLVDGLERLARARGYVTVFAVSNRDEFFLRRGYEPRHIPELDRERSAVSRYKGVFAKDLAPAGTAAG